jgi:serine/threonine protein phosphatase Stp1
VSREPDPARGDSATGQRYRTGCSSHCGHVRTHNEDACLVREDLGLWAVADGMGGHSRGDYASSRVVEHLIAIDRHGTLATLVEAVDEAVQSAHRHLRERGDEEGGIMGTTLVALLVREGHAVVAWAGDSRAYRLRGQQLQRLSHDHSVVQSLIDQGLLHPDEAGGHPFANRITRAVGAGDSLHLEMELLPVVHGDRFLLCSDGLDRYVADADIGATLLAESDPQACAEHLVKLALDRGGADNITCLVLDVYSDSPTPTATLAGKA